MVKTIHEFKSRGKRLVLPGEVLCARCEYQPCGTDGCEAYILLKELLQKTIFHPKNDK